jgi:hypothetical protein
MNSHIVLYVMYGIIGLAVVYYLYRLSRIAAPLPVEKGRKRWLAAFTISFLFLWLVTGLFVLFEQLFSESNLAKTLAPLMTSAFLFHLFFWMLLGMISNYLWDLFRSRKDWSGIRMQELFLPVLISPIVFYSFWGFAASQKAAFVLALIAFQNGFFWQVVFAKAGPIFPGGGPGPGAPNPQIQAQPPE